MTTRVLLVDDSEANRLTLAALLESEAFELTEASSLAEARRALTAGAAFDLVLLDRQLSDGWGVELIPAVRAQLPSCKIIVVSGGGPRDERAAVADADGYFRKGEDLDELFATIRALLAT
jgi:two-component system, NtrC family, response regulator AtoC